MNKRILILALSIICLLGFVTLTNPENIPLAFLLVPFLLIAVIVFTAVDYLVGLFQKDKKSSSRSVVFSAVLTVIIVNFLVLNSVGQLTVQDGLISVAITVILAFYINKFQIKT